MWVLQGRRLLLLLLWTQRRRQGLALLTRLVLLMSAARGARRGCCPMLSFAVLLDIPILVQMKCRTLQGLFQTLLRADLILPQLQRDVCPMLWNRIY